MSLYLPFIPKHLISTYLPYQTYLHTHTKNKQTYYSHIYLHTILFYHYFITSSFHPYPSLLYSSTILLSYPYPFPLSYPLIYQPLFYHILFTFTLSPFYYHTNISFYTFQDKKKIYILPIIYNYYKYFILENTILYYFTYSPSYTILIYTLTPTIYIIYLPFHHYIQYFSTQTYLSLIHI